MPVQDRYSKFQSDQRQFFDELITEDWETYRSPSWDHARTFEVEQLFKRVKPAHILDVGCGCGFHDSVMAKYPFVDRVDAFDYSQKSVSRANSEYAHPKVHRVVADFTAFRAERAYDLVVSFQVIEHLSQPEAYFEFCAKVCKPRGFVAIFTPNKLRWDNRVRALKRRPPVLIDVMHYREYTAHEIFELGKRFGLQPISWFGHTLQMGGVLGNALLGKLSCQRRTQLGYAFPYLSNALGVLMRKV